jgi:hypothetical protein
MSLSGVGVEHKMKKETLEDIWKQKEAKRSES